ncbi:MAG: hypothetical protein RQ885_13220 [Desulfurococcales archaeon]|nr:hypothetical protein [Desulfurococcales archaeon]
MARRMKKRDEKWMWVAKPGDRIFISRTAVLPSKQLSKREFRALEEIVNIYQRCLETCFPTHLGILLRITIGLRVGSIES